MANKRLRRTRAPVNEKKAYNQPKTNDKIQPVKQKALVLAQEIKITRLLANNDKKVRDKVLKRLKKWLVARSQSSFGKLICSILFYTLYNLNSDI